MAVSSIHKGTNFELLESDTENPVSRGTTERSKAVPACHRFSYVLWRHFRTRNVFIDVNGLVAVVPLDLSCGTDDKFVSVFVSVCTQEL